MSLGDEYLLGSFAWLSASPPQGVLHSSCAVAIDMWARSMVAIGVTGEKGIPCLGRNDDPLCVQYALVRIVFVEETLRGTGERGEDQGMERSKERKGLPA